MCDATHRVLDELQLRNQYALAPFRSGLPAIRALSDDDCSLTWYMYNEAVRMLMTSTAWCSVAAAYNSLVRCRLNDTLSAAVRDAAATYVTYIQDYVANLQPGEFGYTAEEMALMKRWGVDPSLPSAKDDGDLGELD